MRIGAFGVEAVWVDDDMEQLDTYYAQARRMQGRLAGRLSPPGKQDVAAKKLPVRGVIAR